MVARKVHSGPRAGRALGSQVYNSQKNGTLAAWAHGQIVLTIAHLDHQPENSDMGNLRAFCQRCHLRYDARHHAATAQATRDAQRGQGRLL